MKCDTGPPPSDPLYAEIYDYSTLEAAYEAVFLYLCELPDNAEEWLINLQNHLIWRSYKPHESEDADMVVFEAIIRTLKKHELKAKDLESVEVRDIFGHFIDECEW